jgi:hypothetical protein
MKKVIFSIILFTGLATAGFAQERQQRPQGSTQGNERRNQLSPEERAQRMTDNMDKQLSLSASQKKNIYQIYLERAQAMSNSQASGNRDQASRDNQGSGYRNNAFQASEERILAVLNNSQRTTYKQMIAAREEKMNNRQQSGQNSQGRQQRGQRSEDRRNQTYPDQRDQQNRRSTEQRDQRFQITPEERAQRITDELDKKLSLSASQKRKIYKINLERAQAMNSSQNSGDQASRDRQDSGYRNNAFQASEERILAVLNRSQKVIYNQMKADRQRN